MLLSTLLACGLGIVALTFVLVPLLRFIPTKASQTAPQINDLSSDTAARSSNAIQEREQSARSALQEIELDYQLGNIAEEDYNTLRERYVRRALLALKSRHDKGQDSSDMAESFEDDIAFDDLIEARLRQIREQDATN